MTRYIGILVTLALAGCGGPQMFDAAGHATGISPQGLAAAEYDLWGPLGNTGEARVWSTGAYEGTVNGEKATIIEIVFDLENTGQLPMTLTDIQLASADVDGIRLRDVPPVRVDGSTVVPPGGDSRVHAFFAVSSHLDPDDFHHFRVSWEVEQGERRYAQRTPFIQAPYYTYGYYAEVRYAAPVAQGGFPPAPTTLQPV